MNERVKIIGRYALTSYVDPWGIFHIYVFEERDELGHRPQNHFTASNQAAFENVWADTIRKLESLTPDGFYVGPTVGHDTTREDQ